MALTIEILAAAYRPVTVNDLALALGAPPAHVQHELERLERRGYVRRTACPVGACSRCSWRAGCAGVATGIVPPRGSEPTEREPVHWLRV